MIFNPAHPGEVLKDYLGDITVAEASRRLGVSRAHLSRILNGRAGISAHFLASFSRAAHIARFLAKDADAARSLAGAAEEATQDTAVSKSGAAGLAARLVGNGLERGSSQRVLTDVVIVMGHAKADGIGME
jgi:plasmid maintenance system antidote protein VapI